MYKIYRYNDDIIADNNLKQCGLYILFGYLNKDGQRTVYIGQTANISHRLSQHVAKKDFWEFAAAFVYEKDVIKKLNKSESEYLEYYTIKNTIETHSYHLLENCQIPSEPYLSDDDKARVMKVYEDIVLLLKVHSLNIFGRPVYNVDEASVKHNVITRVAKELTRHTNYLPDNVYYDVQVTSYDDFTVASYRYIKNGDILANIMMLADGRVYLFKDSILHILCDEKYINKYNLYDKIEDCRLTEDVILDNVKDATVMVSNENNPTIWKMEM